MQRTAEERLTGPTGALSGRGIKPPVFITRRAALPDTVSSALHSRLSLTSLPAAFLGHVKDVFSPKCWHKTMFFCLCLGSVAARSASCFRVLMSTSERR